MEKGFWRLPGVHSTATGYAGGFTPHPSYSEVASGLTGHAEAVLVVYDPARIAYTDLLRWYWQCHDPTQGMGQGADCGTQYRSLIACTDEAQHTLARASRDAYQRAIASCGRSFTACRQITAEIVRWRNEQKEGELPFFYYAEEAHMQHFARPSAFSACCNAQPLRIELPPYETWDVAAEDENEENAPRLPEAFWAQHAPAVRCALTRPNEPIVCY